MAERGEAIEFPVTAPGAAQTASELDALGKSMGLRVRDWDEMSKGSSKASAALGAVGTALGPLGAEFGALGASVSRATGVIGNVTALLGGPLGIAIGVATAGLGVLAKSYSDATAEAEKLQEQQQALAESLRDAGAARSKIANDNAAALEEARLQAELSAGTARIEKFDQEIQRLKELAKATSGTAEAYQALGRAQNLGILREKAAADLNARANMVAEDQAIKWNAEAAYVAGLEKAEAEQALALSDLEDKIAAQEGKIGPNKDGKRGGRSKYYKGTLFGEADDIKPTADPFAAEAEADQKRELAEALLADQAKRDADELRAEAEHRAAMDAIDKQYHEAELARIAETQAAKEQLHAFGRGMLEEELRLGIRAANEAAKGHAMGKKAAVAATGDMLVAAGTRALLEGGIFSATPFMWGSGAGMIAAGTVAIGTGLAMGAASRHMGGGGSGGGKSSGTPQLAPATPVSIQGGAGSQQPQTVIINMQSTLTPNADDYDRMMEAANASRKQGRS